MNFRTVLCFLVLLSVGMTSAEAGTTGKITGIVKDAQSGEAVIGASVVIQGTSQGAATNVDGYYAILNVPPGKYTLAVSAVGYTKNTITNVAVSIDLTTTIDVTLSSTVVQVGEEIVTVATRPLVQRDETAKTAVVSSEQIEALPVTEVSQVLNIQAGMVAGSLRGGRPGEVAYWIDGVPVTDAYNGSQVVEVNKNFVQELQLVSGAFNAEYGEAMSGIVNIVTKEGTPKFSGGAGTYIGGYLTSHTDLFPGNENFRPTSIRNFEGNVSGPVLGDELTFFANARYIYFDGWLFGFNRFNPSNVSYFDSAQTFHLYRDPSGKGDSSRVPMNSSERRYGQMKLTWHALPTVKLTANYIYDWTKSRPWNAFNDFRGYFYDPNGFGNEYNKSGTLIVQLTHTLNDRTFYTVGGTILSKNYKYYLYEDVHDPRYVQPLVATPPDFYSFLTGGTDLRHTYRSTTTWLGKIDLSSQISEHHLVKTGVEYRAHKLTYENINLVPVASQNSFNAATTSPYIQTEVLPLSSLNHDAFKHQPKQFAAYIQDKMEYKSLIVNFGIRFDYFKPDGLILNDDHPNPQDPLYYTYTVDDPNIYNPIKPNNRFFDYNGDGIQQANEPDKTVGDRMAYWYKKAKSKWQVSPRIGFSFPITAQGIVHFSYGHFFAIPHFEDLYQNPSFKVGPNTSNIIGNTDLEAEQTINGELGVQQQLTDDIAVDLTAYLRDIRNLTGTRATLISVYGGSYQYARLTNSDFGYVKGVVLTVEKRLAEGLSAKLDYTFQVARGTASDPNEAYNAAAGGKQPEVQLVSLNWDQRHTANLSVSYSSRQWGASTIIQYGSGAPYTPRAETDISSLLTNSQVKPSFLNVDLQAFYDIPVDVLHLVAFVRVFNLFDARNEVNVFDDTGRAGFTVDQAIAQRTNPTPYVNSLNQWFTRPLNYSEPRRIEFGMNLEF